MAQVAIEIRGRRYELSCRDGGEDRLRLLARLVDTKAAEIARALGTPSEARELLLTALLLADELEESRDRFARAEMESARQSAAVATLADRLTGLADRLEKNDRSA